MKQVKTTKIQKKYKTKDGETKTLEINYAKVADRLGEFRKENPRSKISVKASYDENGNLTHTARLWKDKTEYYELLKQGVNAEDALESCEAEGSSFMPCERLKVEKGFEKNETIAIGRALAILGYAGSGEIASGEEMEEFESWKKQKLEEARSEAIEKITNAKTMKGLLAVWKSLTKDQQLDKDVQARKDARKGELSESSKDSAK
ncbi:hypothetical protein IKF63_01210 [Candidatus Saccharibacteria bacterium]|nr:hypothetical protein [Candidatus Saccharibacteria bacterium]MBR3180681.1 hypothetical protein [Candidatus Saccharibacteria bacterium]